MTYVDKYRPLAKALWALCSKPLNLKIYYAAYRRLSVASLLAAKSRQLVKVLPMLSGVYWRCKLVPPLGISCYIVYIHQSVLGIMVVAQRTGLCKPGGFNPPVATVLLTITIAGPPFRL
jgi:hypothetical protein